MFDLTKTILDYFLSISMTDHWSDDSWFGLIRPHKLSSHKLDMLGED